jgi:hypothetical protein
VLFILSFFLSSWAFAQTALVVDQVSYSPAAQSISCQLLRQRELERAKVIRELDYLSADESRVALSNNLLSNKLFLPDEVWRDASVSVELKVQVPQALADQISMHGLGKTSLITEGPGFVWQSYTTQLPEEFTIQYDAAAQILDLRYLVYQNVYCLDELWTPRVSWEPPAN